MDVIYSWRRLPLKGWILVAVILLAVIRRSGYQSWFAQLRCYGYAVFCSSACEKREGWMIFGQTTRGDSIQHKLIRQAQSGIPLTSTLKHVSGVLDLENSLVSTPYTAASTEFQLTFHLKLVFAALDLSNQEDAVRVFRISQVKRAVFHSLEI
jgi:hypothetical protein